MRFALCIVLVSRVVYWDEVIEVRDDYTKFPARCGTVSMPVYAQRAGHGGCLSLNQVFPPDIPILVRQCADFGIFMRYRCGRGLVFYCYPSNFSRFGVQSWAPPFIYPGKDSPIEPVHAAI